MDESAYFETALADDVAPSTTAGSSGQDEGTTSGVVVRLTPEGQQIAADLEDPGEGATAGSDEHTALLKQVQQALQRVGEIQLVTQDGSAQPDAVGGLQRTVNGETETIKLTVEAERSTFRHPTKPLQNLKKAQERDAVALFAVPAGDSDEGQAETAHAERLAGILADPINQQRAEPRYYVYDDRKLTFHGGARDGGETVVRRITGTADSGRSVWVHRNDTAVLVAPDGKELATIEDFNAVVSESRIDEFPAYYTYDSRTDLYMVHEHGQHHRYEAKADLQKEWVSVKKPFIPEHELTIPDYGSETYAILVVDDHDESRDSVVDESTGKAEVAVYLNGKLHPLERLVETFKTSDIHPAGTTKTDPEPSSASSLSDAGGTLATDNSDATKSTTGPPTPNSGESSNTLRATAETSQRSAMDGVAAFAELELVFAPENRIPFRPVYDRYEEFTTTAGFESLSDQMFTTALQDHFAPIMDEDEWPDDQPVTSDGKWYSPWGRTVHCLIGVDLRNPSILDEYGSETD